MTYQVALEFTAKTDPGRVRAHNEDSYALSPALGNGFGLAILADGMGGHNAGEVASALAIQIVRQELEPRLQDLAAASSILPEKIQEQQAQQEQSGQLQSMVLDAVQAANSAILDAAANESDYSGMGTTLVLALFHHAQVMIAHVGDSRAYRLRGGTLTQITRDHSMLQEHIDAGLISPEQARFSQNKNIITRALGVSAALLVDIDEEAVEPDDLYLLCSDGLSDMLEAEEIHAILNHFSADRALACETLVEAANAYGGRDNVSVILIKIMAQAGPETVPAVADSAFGRFLNWLK
jgi:protein phosphatase